MVAIATLIARTIEPRTIHDARLSDADVLKRQRQRQRQRELTPPAEVWNSSVAAEA